MRACVGVDVGGTHVGVGLVSPEGILLSSSSTSWDNLTLTPREAVDVILRSINDLQLAFVKKNGIAPVIEAVGIGCPGWVKQNVVVAASNLPNFKYAPLADMIEQALGVPALLLNDADAAVCAEVWGNPNVYKSCKSVAMVTLGTGIGFGLILNDQLYQGSHGLLEGGHMIVSPAQGSRVCGCGQVGCVEAYSSATNTALRLEELDAADSGVDVQKLTGQDVFARYAVADYNAVSVVEETAEHLAVLVVNICRVLDPDVIVFGGGMARSGEALMSVVRKHLAAKTWKVLPTEVQLVTARSEDAGVLGAALAARKRLQRESPSAPPLEASAERKAIRRWTQSPGQALALGLGAVGLGAAAVALARGPRHLSTNDAMGGVLSLALVWSAWSSLWGASP